jgi:hypothetical protein
VFGLIPFIADETVLIPSSKFSAQNAYEFCGHKRMTLVSSKQQELQQNLELFQGHICLPVVSPHS